MKSKYPPEWRAQAAWKKKFYARYMKWLERLGYAVVALVIGAFIFAFNYRVDDVITADKVQISAMAYPIKMDRPVYVVRSLVDNFTEVSEGQAVLEVVDGEVAIDEYLAWNAVNRMGRPHNFERPSLTSVKAGRAGIFVFVPELVETTIEADTELGQIRDYNELVLTANLAGQGVANAQAGGLATLKSIAVSSGSGILVRGTADGVPVVSGRLLDTKFKDGLTSAMNEVPLKIRDDIPLQISEISKLEIDANLDLQDSGNAGVQVDPSASSLLKAEVISGEHSATVQFAKLPPDVQSQINGLIAESLKGKVVTDLAGRSHVIGDVNGFNTVFQVAGVPGSGKSGAIPIQGTAVTRNFEAKLRIQSPPSYLVNAVRNADAEGQTVTVKVELKTGDRPIATLLLKRS